MENHGAASEGNEIGVHVSALLYTVGHLPLFTEEAGATKVVLGTLSTLCFRWDVSSVCFSVPL